jgi:hypothetical protein
MLASNCILIVITLIQDCRYVVMDGWMGTYFPFVQAAQDRLLFLVVHGRVVCKSEDLNAIADIRVRVSADQSSLPPTTTRTTDCVLAYWTIAIDRQLIRSPSQGKADHLSSIMPPGFRPQNLNDAFLAAANQARQKAPSLTHNQEVGSFLLKERRKEGRKEDPIVSHLPFFPFKFTPLPK